MKKRKFKKITWFLIICLIVFPSIIIITIKNKNNKSIILEEKKLDYISEVLKYNTPLDEDFLKYIMTNYGENSIKELLEYLKKDEYNKDILHKLTGNSYIVLNDLYNGAYDNNNKYTIINDKKDNVSISFAGDVSLADNWEIMPYYKSRDKKIYGVLSEDLVEYMNNTDIMIVNNEFCFSDRGTPLSGKMYTFRANPSNVSIYKEMGVDMVTLANNHVYDFGIDAFLDTLDTLKSANIPYIGAGVNSKEAEDAHYFIINGYKISFLNATRAEKYILTKEAKENEPGVFRAYDPNPLAKRISEEKKVSDFVIVLMHWGLEDSRTLEEVIINDGKLYIDSGADLIVGSHAHMLQGMEYYKDKLIAYNLGDFLFSKKSDYTGILTLNLSFDGDMTYKFIPAYQKNYKTIMLYDDSANDLFDLMKKLSINIEIEKDGTVKYGG